MIFMMHFILFQNLLTDPLQITISDTLENWSTLLAVCLLLLHATRENITIEGCIFGYCLFILSHGLVFYLSSHSIQTANSQLS